MKYKIGDIILLRDDLFIDEKYGDHYFTEEMTPLLGSEGRITEIDTFMYSGYKIEGSENYWTDQMIVQKKE